ncbi:MAG: DegT/DnrJ/EryC1/StrS family aminotransferase, partial [Gammaproteobacteria bacterium]
VACGINGKMNEFQAALGLVQLNHVDAAMEQRALIAENYRVLLKDIEGLRMHIVDESIYYNNAYFPIFIEDSFPISRDELYLLLKSENIHTRRYFYPLISEFPMYRGLPSTGDENLANAKRIAEQVICLPIFPGLEEAIQEHIRGICKSTC